MTIRIKKDSAFAQYYEFLCSLIPRDQHPGSLWAASPWLDLHLWKLLWRLCGWTLFWITLTGILLGLAAALVTVLASIVISGLFIYFLYSLLVVEICMWFQILFFALAWIHEKVFPELKFTQKRNAAARAMHEEAERRDTIWNAVQNVVCPRIEIY